MVSTHTSSRGILWVLGGEDIDNYKDNYKDNFNTNTNTNNSINIEYNMVKLPEHNHDNDNNNNNDKKNFENLPFLDKLVTFIKYILYI